MVLGRFLVPTPGYSGHCFEHWRGGRLAIVFVVAMLRVVVRRLFCGVKLTGVAWRSALVLARIMFGVARLLVAVL